MKNSFLIPSFEGGIKTPKSCNAQSKSSENLKMKVNYGQLNQQFNKYVIWVILIADDIRETTQSGPGRLTLTAS